MVKRKQIDDITTSKTSSSMNDGDSNDDDMMNISRPRCHKEHRCPSNRNDVVPMTTLTVAVMTSSPDGEAPPHQN